MKSKIVIYKNILQDPDKLINDIEHSVYRNQLVWHTAGVDSGDGVIKNKSIRDTFSIGIPYEINSYNSIEIIKNTRDILNENFSPYINEYLLKNNMNISTYQNYEILKYGYGQKFDEHIDHSSAYPRTLSLVYYPNDNYEGGEIEFTQVGVKIKPEKNSLLLFPSGQPYTHKVYPVINGIRYSIVQWMN